MVDATVPAIEFHQYGDKSSDSDRLILFAAPAKVLALWAGVPRKGWRIRMLYQRWVTPSRERDLSLFWERAARPSKDKGEDYILGPTAITLAVQSAIRVENGVIRLTYDSPIDFAADPTNNLQRLAKEILPRVRGRLNSAKASFLDTFRSNPLGALPETGHDYVLEFALQLAQMEADPRWFIDENAVSDDELREMIEALEALCRPAIVVDGQHRLLGAAEADADVTLPVVAMPHSSWGEQVYQFIVINEKAQKVDSALLTDIFGSSLTQEEQSAIRDRLARARVDVEARIAAVIANRDERSPFFGMVRVPIGGAGANSDAYITDTTIRLLIDGSTRNARGWRSDDDFYAAFVNPTFSERAEWDSWTSGLWRPYWFKFWETVAAYYNEQAVKEGQQPLWDSKRQTNLTRAATLRTLQKLFMDKMIAHMMQLGEIYPMLADAVGAENAGAVLAKRRQEDSIPRELEQFSTFITSRFLQYVPVRIFLAPWVSSLDDAEGLAELYSELEKAHDRLKAGQVYRVGNRQIFSTANVD
jgi:hypothetical protein